MKRFIFASLLLAGVLFSGWAQASDPRLRAVTPKPDAAETARALEACTEFADACYKGDYAAAFKRVRGIPNPDKAAAEFVQVLRNDVASWAFRQLSTCQSNVEILATAIESYARDHEGRYPPDFAALMTVRDVYLDRVPTCPAHGTYEFKREAQGFRVYCHENAHQEIGVRGNFPAFVTGKGLTIGDQKITLGFDPTFAVEKRSVTYDDWIGNFGVMLVKLDEVSALGELENARKRDSRFIMASVDGEWKVDLYLSLRDMSFVYDFEKWQQTAAIPKQILYYYVMSHTPFMLGDDYQDRAELSLKICESNLRNISLAVESWSVAHNGSYPTRPGFASIIPTLLARLPTCPSGGVYVYVPAQRGDSYTVRCKGHAHADANVLPDYPAASPINGVQSPKKD